MSFFPVTEWTEEFEKLVPILRMYFEEGSSGIMAELGGQLGSHAVHKLDEAVNAAVLALAESTLSTTDKTVEDAVSATREAIRQGLSENEANDKLRDRIGEIFTELSDRRSMLIAETESTRCKMAGEILAIQDAGVECKKVWLPDSMACPLCRKLAAMGPIPLDKEYQVEGKGPYATTQHPPAHPSCRCTLQYEFE